MAKESADDVLEMRSVLGPKRMLLIGVLAEQLGTFLRMRWTMAAKRRTGQRTGSLVRRWVRESILMPFF